MNAKNFSSNTSRLTKTSRLERLLPSIAVATIVAVVGGISLIKQTSEYSTEIIAWWLVYAVCCALALNTRVDDTLSDVALMAMVPAAVPVLQAAIIQVITRRDVPISGQDLDPGRAALISAVDWIGIFLFSYGRRSILQAIEWAKRPETRKTLKNIELTVRALALLIGTIALIVAGKGYFSK